MGTPLISESDRNAVQGQSEQSVSWRGRSGRTYDMVSERLDDFVLKDHDLYLIAEGGRACWIGTAGDLIEDQSSRARFRAAVKTASAVLRLPHLPDAVERMATAWDMEGGHLASRELAALV